MARLIHSAVWVIASVGLLATSGCHKRFYGKVSQPNPLAAPVDTLRISEPIHIITGDMELQMPMNQAATMQGSFARNRRYPLDNVASFTVVSRDRLRFHVQLEHKWSEYADVTRWHAILIDDRGRIYRPESVEKRMHKVVVHMWDYQLRSVRRTHGNVGDIVAVHDDGHLRRQALGNLSVFRGKADFVFYHHDIFTPKVKRMTLLVGRSGLSFSFTWNFEDQKTPKGPGSTPVESSSSTNPRVTMRPR